MTRARLVVLVLLAVALVWLGVRAVRAFDQDGNAAEAAAVLSAPDKVTYPLAPVQPGRAAPGRAAPPPPGAGTPERAAPTPPGAGTPERAAPPPPGAGAPEREGSPQQEEALGGVHSPDGRFSYRPGTWLSVVDLGGLEPVSEEERYLVFVRNWAGWTLAGAARPGPGGNAQVRSAAEPRPATIYEVVVTRAVDDATSIPHGQPVLQWFDASLGPPRVRPFDFARGT